MIVSSPSELSSDPIFYKMEKFIRGPLYVKIESLNIARSIKLKTAKHLIEYHEDTGRIKKTKNRIICSTSGNLGVALSVLCKEKGYELICVVDVNTNQYSIDIMEMYGAEVIVISEQDEFGGYLGSRLKRVARMQQEDEDLFWINQYDDIQNPEAHFCTTAKEIHNEIPELEYLFIGAGTTGTLMGCAKYFKIHSPQTKIIAVDAAGSVTFSGQPKKRRIPGLGTSKAPSIVDQSYLDDIIVVEEPDTVHLCHYVLERYGLCVGGSTGSVLAAIRQNYSHIEGNAVAVSPDMGDHYHRTIYNKDWLMKNGLAGSLLAC